MSTWVELLSRELAVLALLGLLGAGPAALLHASHDRAVRLALAPAYGLALGCGVLTTGLWLMPGNKLLWLGLLPLVAASVAVAVVARRRGWAPPAGRLSGGDVAQLAVVVVVVLVALSRPLGDLGTVGPIGGYAVADSAGYVAEIDGAQEVSARTAATYGEPLADRTIAYWSGIAGGYQQIGFDAVQAPLAVLLGIEATDLHTSALIAVILTLALGVLAAVRLVTRSRTWAAPAAAVLAAGPLLMQLLMDGSQGALVGLAMVVPFTLAGWTALRTRRRVDVALAGLLAGGIGAGYPLWIPPIVLGSAVVLAVVLVRRWIGVRSLAAGVGGLVLAAVVTAPYAFVRNGEYWLRILRGEHDFAGLPPYDMTFGTLPAWLLQTREFYGRALPEDALLTAGLVPLLLLAVIAIGVVRHRVAAGLLALIGACALLAVYTITSQDCSYCAQRNLLPVGPTAAVLIGVGLAALAARVHVAAAVAVGAVALGFVAAAHIDTGQRIVEAAYVLDPEVREVLEAVDPDEGLHIEGFGQGAKPKMEEPIVYHVANERIEGPPSLAMFVDDLSAQMYIGGARTTAGPELDLDYEQVLTRLREVRNEERREVRGAGPIALEERVGRYDVTIEGGVRVAMSDQDPRGRAWLAPGVPLVMFVTGGGEEPLWVRLRMREVTGLDVRPGNDLDARRTGDGKDIDVCVQADGTGPGRLASVIVHQSPGPPVTVPALAPPVPVSAGYVTSVDVVAEDCSPLPR